MKSQILSCSIEVTWCSQSTVYYRLESQSLLFPDKGADLQGGPVQLREAFSDT